MSNVRPHKLIRYGSEPECPRCGHKGYDDWWHVLRDRRGMQPAGKLQCGDCEKAFFIRRSRQSLFNSLWPRRHRPRHAFGRALTPLREQQMDRPEDELPPLFIEAAQAVVMMPPFATEEQTGKAIEAVRLALLKTREEALEEARVIALSAGPEHYASTHGGLSRGPSQAEAFIASAIRQHSQKGER